MYPVIHPPDYRQARMGCRFPHSIYYREVEGGILIVAVHHTRREPGYWLARL